MSLMEFGEHRNGDIFGHMRANRFPELFSASNGADQRREMEFLNELTTFSLAVDVISNSRVAAWSSLSHTFPARGIPLMIEAGRKLPEYLPFSGFQVLSFDASSWDGEAAMNASRKNYDLAADRRAAIEKDRAEKSANELLKHCSSKYFIRYETELGIRRSVLICGVESKPGMDEYFDRLSSKLSKDNPKIQVLNEADTLGLSVKMLSESRSDRLLELDKFREQVKTDPKFRETWEKLMSRAIDKGEQSIDELELSAFENDCWALTDDFFYHGHCDDVLRLIEEYNEGKPSSEPLASFTHDGSLPASASSVKAGSSNSYASRLLEGFQEWRLLLSKRSPLAVEEDHDQYNRACEVIVSRLRRLTSHSKYLVARKLKEPGEYIEYFLELSF